MRTSHRTIESVFTEWREQGYLWSDERVGRATGLSKSSIQRLRTGESAPQPRTLKALLKLPGFKEVYIRVFPEEERQYV